MKQHITPKQAKELSKYKFYTLFPDLVIRDDWNNFHHKKITVGKLIELTNVQYLFYDFYVGEWRVGESDTRYKSYKYTELCDALWEYTKRKYTEL